MDNRSEKYLDYRNEIYTSSNLNSLRIKVHSSINSNEETSTSFRPQKNKETTVLDKYNKKRNKNILIYLFLVLLGVSILAIGVVLIIKYLIYGQG